MQRKISVQQLISLLKPIRTIGPTDKNIIELVSLESLPLKDTDLAWVSTKNINMLAKVGNGVVICPISDEMPPHAQLTLLQVENPRRAFQQVLSHFFTYPLKTGVSRSAKIDSSVTLGEGIYIGENVVIESNCTIGNFTRIDHNSVIKENTVIGTHVLIGSNCTIGSYGFGYELDENGRYVQIPHIGNVWIGDNVELGNNTCIDKAVLGSTRIMNNAKIDNLVHIAHGVVVGENSMVIANAMIGGSSKIGKDVWVAPSASVINKVSIQDQATIGMGAVVLRDVESKTTVVGNPAKQLIKK